MYKFYWAIQKWITYAMGKTTECFASLGKLIIKYETILRKRFSKGYTKKQ